MRPKFQLLLYSLFLGSFMQHLHGQCDVSDSTFYTLNSSNLSITAFPGMSFLPRTAAGSISKPLYSEGRSSNPALATNSTAVYGSAPSKNNVFFGGDDGTNGYANTQILATKIHNLFTGPLTIRGTYYNRSGHTDYNESYLGIAPANYVYYAPLDCDPNNTGNHLGRQGIVFISNAANSTSLLLDYSSTDSSGRMIKGPAFMSLDYSKWYTMEVTFQIISNQLYMVSGSLDDGTKKEPLGSMIRIGNALQMGWLDSVVVVTGVDDMATDLVSIKKRCAGCVVEDSIIFDMLPKFFTKTNYSGSSSQGPSDFLGLKTPFALECISSNDGCFATAKACYAPAPNRNTIYFAGDAPIPQGYSSTSVVTKQTYNIFEGPLTIRASFYNRSNAPEYNESWFSILPSDYKYYCSPVLVPTTSRQGVRVGGWPTQTIIVDSRSETVDEVIIEPFKVHNISNWGKWYEARVVWDTANGMFRCAEYSINGGSGWVKVWNNPITIGPVSNFPWLNSVRMSILGDDMIDSIGFLKIHCVTSPKNACSITKSTKTLCRNNGQYNIENCFQVNSKTPVGATYKIVAFNGDRNHQNVSNYNLGSGKLLTLNWPGGAWRIQITTPCGSIDSTTITLINEPIVKAYAADTQRICASEKTIPLLLFVDSTSVSGGSWSWSGSLVSGNTLNVFRNSDSLYSYARPTMGIYTSPLGCKDTVNIQVLVRNTPTISFMGGDTLRSCEGTPIALNAQFASTSNITWMLLPPSDGTLSSNTGNSATYTPGANDNTQGRAWVKISTIPLNNDPCPASSDTAILLYYPKPKADILDSARICVPARATIQSAELAGIPAHFLQYNWTLNPGGTQSGSTFSDSFPTSGIFDLSLNITDTRSNCADQVDKKGAIHIYPKPVAQFTVAPSNVQVTPNTLFSFNNTSKLDVSIFTTGALTYQWNFSDKNAFSQSSTLISPQFQAAADTNTYRIRLTVISDKNCIDSSIQQIRVVYKFNFHAPSAFCPQGLNNRYRIEAYNYQSAIIRIYSRWGEKLYESENLLEGWDGNYIGLPCQEGVYIVIADLRSFDGYHNIYEGTFHLLR
jgi:hypothetical protein